MGKRVVHVMNGMKGSEAKWEGGRGRMDGRRRGRRGGGGWKRGMRSGGMERWVR